jgi:DNA-directed RNA polymerase subunit RPC12/RpoP
MSLKNHGWHGLDPESDLPPFEKIPHRRDDRRGKSKRSSHEHAPPNNAEFKCSRCNAWVNNDTLLSGVNHRNHCPYCLHSRHLDALKSGDRLSGCQAVMRPVGLTLKRTRNKYARAESGELMLIHQCLGCGRLSINRIAADDHSEGLLAVFNSSGELTPELQGQIAAQEIRLLGVNDLNIVLTRLYGVGLKIGECVPAIRQNADAG